VTPARHMDRIHANTHRSWKTCDLSRQLGYHLGDARILFRSSNDIHPGRVGLPGDSACTIGDAGRVISIVYAIANGRLVMPIRCMLPDGASRTTPSSISGDSSCPDRHGISSCIDVPGSSSHPEMFGDPSNPGVLCSSNCPSSSTLVVPDGMLAMPDGASHATPISLLVMPVGHWLPNNASSGSPGNGSRYTNSSMPAIPHDVLVAPIGASMAALTSIPIGSSNTGRPMALTAGVPAMAPISLIPASKPP